MQAMLKMTCPVLLAGLLTPLAGSPQSPAAVAPAVPQLSPRAAYQDAMHPVDMTRRSVANWSDTEIAALKVSIARSAAGCAARDPKTFQGGDLIDLARLCALGQNWNSVIEAATLYISAAAPAKPLLTEAYAARIDAQLHVKDEASALAGSKAMLATVPYGPLTAETINEALEYMQFSNTPDALALAGLRQPLLLAQMQHAGLPQPPAGPDAAVKPAETAPQTAPAAGSEPPQSLRDLYADGLKLAELQQLSGEPDAARATVADLDAALPASLQADDARPIEALRRRYAILGKKLPPIDTVSYLSLPNKVPQLPAPNAMTALLLFPDWCAQCVRMGSQFPETVFTVAGHEAYLYGLLAETVKPRPQSPDSSSETVSFEAENAARLLQETPTIVVPAATLDQFAATDVPFLILTDSQGVVRVAQAVGEDALALGGTIDSAIGAVGARWLTPAPLPRPPARHPVGH
jgi:hypothetical protein